ncbi:MAG: hypothetical protein ACMXYD_01475 [Candidatus Woesearchaeota archaeon]
MVHIYVSKKLEKEIVKRLSKKEADDLFLQIYSLKENPHKGDILTNVGKLLVKELKYKKFRVYFIQSKDTLKILGEEDFRDEIVKFVALSQKGSEQQRVIN